MKRWREGEYKEIEWVGGLKSSFFSSFCFLEKYIILFCFYHITNISSKQNILLFRGMGSVSAREGG